MLEHGPLPAEVLPAEVPHLPHGSSGKAPVQVASCGTASRSPKAEGSDLQSPYTTDRNFQVIGRALLWTLIAAAEHLNCLMPPRSARCRSGQGIVTAVPCFSTCGVVGIG